MSGVPRPGELQPGRWRRLLRVWECARALQREDAVERRGSVVEAGYDEPVVVEGFSGGRGPFLRGEGFDTGEDVVCGPGGFRRGSLGAEGANEDDFLDELAGTGHHGVVGFRIEFVDEANRLLGTSDLELIVSGTSSVGEDAHAVKKKKKKRRKKVRRSSTGALDRIIVSGWGSGGDKFR